MEIKVTGRRDTGLTAPVAKDSDVVTAVIEYDPETSPEFTCRLERPGKRPVFYTGFKGFALEKGRYYEFILIRERVPEQHRRTISPVIDKVNQVTRDGEEVPQSEWLSISYYPKEG